jgi:hypothetical protein
VTLGPVGRVWRQIDDRIREAVRWKAEVFKAEVAEVAPDGMTGYVRVSREADYPGFERGPSYVIGSVPTVGTEVYCIGTAFYSVVITGGGGGGSVSDASTTTKGVTKLSTAPASSTNPIAVGDNDSRMTNARTPTAHASSHQPGGTDAMAVDAAAATGSLRTLGTGAAQAAAGNDARLSDARTPTAHAASHSSGSTDPITHNNLAGLTTGDPHTQYHNDTRGDARYPRITTIASITANYTASSTTDELVLANATSGAIVVSLPTAVGVAGRRKEVKKTDASTNAVTIDPAGSETIDGDATIFSDEQDDVVALRSDGANWRIVTPIAGGGGGTSTPIHSFHAYQSVQQVNITASTNVALEFQTEVHDSDNNFASHTYTCPVAGLYHFGGGFKITPAVDTRRVEVRLMVNGTTVQTLGYSWVTGTAEAAAYGSITRRFAASDTVRLVAFHSFGVNTSDIEADANFTYFYGHLERAT